MKRIIVTVAAVLLLVGCSSTPDGSSKAPAGSAPSEGEAESDRTAVPWDDYAADVQPRIDDLTTAGDCAGLQAQFDTADANGDATEARTGHNNADLMSYIDESLQLAECY